MKIIKNISFFFCLLVSIYFTSVIAMADTTTPDTTTTLGYKLSKVGDGGTSAKAGLYINCYKV